MALYDINGNLITSGSSGDSFFEETSSFVGGEHLTEIPTVSSASGNTDEWEYASYNANANSFYQILGNVGYVYKKRMFKDVVYLRSLTKTPYTSTTGMGIKLVQNSDFLENPSGEATALIPERLTVEFNVDGSVGKNLAILSDGTYSVTDGTIDDAVGYVAVSKYVIPEGYYGVLYTTANTASTMARWAENWVTMFTLNPIDNITITDVETYNTQLEALETLRQGFAKGLASDSYFQKYFSQYADMFLQKDVYLQTKGKSLYIGGDSLHDYAGGSGFTGNGFVSKFNKILGFKTVANNGYAGSTWTGTTGGGGIKRVTDLVANGVPYDVFVLAWGTNDDTGGNGTIDDEASNVEGCTMVSAMKWCISQLRTTFRYSAIGVIIPPPKGTNEGMKEKGDLMIQVCEQMHVPYKDMRKYLSMDDMSGDTVHLGYGADKYGSAEAQLILDICPYGEPLQ